MTPAAALRDALAAESRAALVTLDSVEGSTPRDTDAWMVVRPSGSFTGTIGGGALEWETVADVLAILRGADRPLTRVRSLGPDLGQCCGGRVTTRIALFTAADRAAVDARAEREAETRTPVLLFGAGHVGRALVLALAPLPFQVRWIDSRPDAFPERGPSNVTPVHAESPAEEFSCAPDGTLVFVMTHSHALDLDIVARALRTPGVRHVGLIGSATKRARFAGRLRDAGFTALEIERVACPIGVPGIRGKEPPVIAAATAAELLVLREKLARGALQEIVSAA